MWSMQGARRHEIPRAKKAIKKSIEEATLEMWNEKVENFTRQGDFTNLLIHEKENVGGGQIARGKSK